MLKLFQRAVAFIPVSQAYRMVPGRVVFRGCTRTATLVVLALLLGTGGRVWGQTTVLAEGFEGAFPSAWIVGDANAAGTVAYWNYVPSTFGGEATHSGVRKGYCAGTGYAGTADNPTYRDYMLSFMERSVDLTAFAAATLRFWHKIPTIETPYDSCRVLMDGMVLWTTNAGVTSWTEVALNLSAYVGGVHLLRFEFASDGSVVAEGWYLDDIEVAGFLPPPNDNFASAQTLVGLSGSVNSVNTDATKEEGEPNHAGNAGGHSVWYQWTAMQNGTVTFNTFGSGFDTLLAVYTGASLASLLVVGANDDFQPPNRASSVTFQAALGRIYMIAVDGYDGATGGFWLNWQHVNVTEDIQALAITNYAALVIDSDGANPDPVYERDMILARSEIQSVNSSPVAHFTTYTLSYRLLDPGDQPVRIFDSTGVVNANATFNVTNMLAIPSGGAITNINVAAIRPAARLQPTVLYRLELSIYRYGNFTGETVTDAGKGYYHFTNLVSGDPALNVIAQATLIAWNRTSAVQTVTGKKHFSVDANYALLRYDNFNAPIAPASVPVTLEYQLIDATAGDVIPLKQNQASFVESLPSYAMSGTGIKQPAFQFFTRTLNVEPADGVQLDAVNKQYRVSVRISHVDQAGQPSVTGNTLPSADARLLHFNGHLFFGGIDTIFTSLASDPPLVSVTPSFVRSTLAVNNFSGLVVGSPKHVYGDGTPLSVILRVNGNAELASGSVVLTLNPTGPDFGDAAGIQFLRGAITLNAFGGVADFLVRLPAGLGYTTDITQKYLESTGLFPAQPLNQQLLPSSNPVFMAPIWICEETKPVWIEVNSTMWEVAAGRFVMTPTSATEYVRRAELDALDSSPVPPEMKVKRSNEQYFRSVFRVISPQVIVTVGPGGSAQLKADITFASGEFRAHFPYDALVQWTTGGMMMISNDVVQVGTSSLLGAEPVELAYNRDCLSMNCPSPNIGPATNRFDVGGELKFTCDGGLAAQGTLQAAAPLNWGYIYDQGGYAHATHPVQPGGFLMAGIFLPGTQPAESDEDRPPTILLSGMSPSNPGAPERPQQEAAYADGLGDYPGLNFRVSQHPGLHGESMLGGTPTGPYSLTSRSKYYLRWGGVNGIHEAVPGSPMQLMIYGYFVNFGNFGLSFLDSDNYESRTQGYVDLPYPAGITNNFEELMFNCLGGLEDTKVPKAEATKYKLLSYWNADIVTLGLKFDRKDGLECSAGEGWLVLALKAHATHVDEPLYGEVGFHPSGNIISRFDNVLDDFDSRLKLPNVFKLKGPAQEQYDVTPVADAYFNTHGIPEVGTGPGFVNIIGKVDVPFFEDLQVHLHTAGKTNDVTTSQLLVKIMGGWPDQGFRDTGGKHFFDTTDFDRPNAGFPSSLASYGFAQPVPNSNYENNLTAELYHPRAKRTWLEVVNFDYPLTWNGASRSFKSYRETNSELLVLKVDNQVKYLSAGNAELAFGAQYDGLPTLNIANLAFNAIDEETGAIQAFINAGLGPARDVIADALGGMDVLLDPNLRNFFDGPLDDRIQPVIANLYDELKNGYLGNPATWKANATNKVVDYFTSLTVQNYFYKRFADIFDAGSSQDAISNLTNKLNKLSAGVAQVHGILNSIETSRKLAQGLIGQFAGKYAGQIGDDKIEEALKKAEAAFNEIKFTLGQLQQAVNALKAKLDNPASDLYQELVGTMKATPSNPLPQTQITAFLDLAKADVLAYIGSLNDSVGDPFVVYPREKVEGFIRERIEDRFFGSPIAASVQTVFKHRFYDLDGSVRGAIDSGFQQLNAAIRDVISEVLAQLDDKLTELLGDVAAVMGAGKINGYAHIKGDSLNLLRLDAYARLKLTSEMEFNAFFQIRELNSKTESGVCPGTGAGTEATEVTFGADGSLAHWISSGVNAKVDGKFTFGPGMKVLNVSGGLELNGPQTFEAMTIESLKASIGFGLQENYFSGATTIKLGGFEGSGGVFFGQVCDLAPIEMWDEEVPEVLGTPNPTFTGAYWYQEAWIPVSEILLGIPATCFFRFDAGTGTGFFFFAEGPTFGGRMHMGASGEALCLFSIKGTVDLTGAKTANGIRMQGSGKLTGKVGKCPFCKKFKKKVKVTYDNGDWDASY